MLPTCCPEHKSAECEVLRAGDFLPKVWRQDSGRVFCGQLHEGIQTDRTEQDWRAWQSTHFGGGNTSGTQGYADVQHFAHRHQLLTSAENKTWWTLPQISRPNPWQGLILVKTCPDQPRDQTEREIITILWPISPQGLQGAGDRQLHIVQPKSGKTNLSFYQDVLKKKISNLTAVRHLMNCIISLLFVLLLNTLICCLVSYDTWLPLCSAFVQYPVLPCD